MTEEAEVVQFKYPDKFVTEYGNELALPKPTAKIEKKVYRNIGLVLQEFPELKTIIGNFMGSSENIESEGLADNIFNIIQNVFTKVPEPLSKIASAILDFDQEEVEDNLTYSDMILLVALFFRLQTSRFAGMSSKLVEDFGLNTTSLSEAAEQAVTPDETAS